MKFDQNPFFRKVPIAWHDSDLFCIVVCILMALVFSFARIGLRLTSQIDQYHDYGWLPMLLMLLSGIILATNIIRILTRMARRRSDADE